MNDDQKKKKNAIGKYSDLKKITLKQPKFPKCRHSLKLGWPVSWTSLHLFKFRWEQYQWSGNTYNDNTCGFLPCLNYTPAR